MKGGGALSREAGEGRGGGLHRINERLVEVNERLVEVNEKLIVNERLVEVNERLVKVLRRQRRAACGRVAAPAAAKRPPERENASGSRQRRVKPVPDAGVDIG